MNRNLYINILLLLTLVPISQGQVKTWREDSVQFKVYSIMHVNKLLQLDSITIKKVFCDYCNENQINFLKYQALERTKMQRLDPKYYKRGDHRLSFYMRYSRADFKNIQKTQ